jgi:hypothetical protein
MSSRPVITSVPYTTTNSFSVNAKGVARAAGLLAQQCRRHLEALQYTQPALYRH